MTIYSHIVNSLYLVKGFGQQFPNFWLRQHAAPQMTGKYVIASYLDALEASFASGRF